MGPGQSREIWPEKSIGGHDGCGKVPCTYPLIRNCSKPSSVAVGNPWKCDPVHITRINPRRKVPGATYRSAAVVALAALHTVPGEVPNTTAGVASLAAAAEAPVAAATAATAVSTTTATTRRLRAAARDMAGLTTAVALSIRATTTTPPTVTTATARSRGAVTRLRA